MNFEWISFGVKPSLTKNFITTRYSILSILSDTDNTPASDSCIKQTTWKNDLQFHMDAYDRCTNLGKKNLADTVAIYGRGWELFRPPTYVHDWPLDCRSCYRHHTGWNTMENRHLKPFPDLVCFCNWSCSMQYTVLDWLLPFWAWHQIYTQLYQITT